LKQRKYDLFSQNSTLSRLTTDAIFAYISLKVLVLFQDSVLDGYGVRTLLVTS